MRILGIDPGYAIVGVGVIEYNGQNFKTLEYGAITTPAGTAFPARLQMIYSQMQEILALYKPESMAVEKLYFNTNTTTAIDVAQARGVILLSAQQAGVPVYEYTPLQVKQAVVGYGRAEKHQVIEMTKSSSPSPGRRNRTTWRTHWPLQSAMPTARRGRLPGSCWRRWEDDEGEMRV